MNTSFDSNKYFVSVVIPCHNSDDTIADTLEALSRQRGEFRYEVIVVNSSNDLTPEIINEKFPWVKLIQLKDKTAAGVSRNVGAEKATGKFIAFVDSDCTVGSRWLEKMLQYYSSDYCGIGGPVENADPEDLISSAGHILEFSEFYIQREFLAVDHIPSGNLFLLRKTFDESGGFPERLFPQEDRFFSWKLRRQTGKRFLFHPEIKVRHHHRTTLKSFLNHQALIGRAGAEILKVTDLPGSGMIRHKLLVNVLLPLFPLRKLARCVFRTLRWKPREILMRPQVLPILCLGMFFWMLGFFRAANRSE